MMNRKTKLTKALGRAFAGFRTNRRGVVAITGALLLAPPALMMLGNTHLAREVANLTAVQQATDQAAVCAGVWLQSDGRTTDPKLVENWVRANTVTLQNSAAVSNITLYQSAGTNSVTQVGTSYTTLAPGGAIGNVHNPLLGQVVASSKVETYYRPTEIVFGFDVSRMTGAVDGAQEAIEEILDRLYDGKTDAQQLKISLFAYGEQVNVGRKYADKLIDPETRKLSVPGSELAPDKKQENYERQKALLEARNPGLITDLLDVNGPGYSAEYAAVARPVLKSNSREAIADYLKQLDNPPGEGVTEPFRLMMGDGRATYVECEEPRITTNWRPKNWYDTAYFWGGVYDRLSDFVFVEDEWWQKNTYVQDAVSSTWGMGYYLIAPYNDASINVDVYSPTMPILAGSSDKDEVIERLGMLRATGATTTCDEAFTWAYRLLNPTWASVWSDGGSYPAPFWDKTEKHAFLVIDAPWSGFTPVKYGSDQQPNIVPQILEKFAQANIKLHIITGGDNLVLDDINEGMAKYGETLGWEVIVPDDWDFIKALRNAVKQRGRVRISAV